MHGIQTPRWRSRRLIRWSLVAALGSGCGGADPPAGTDAGSDAPPLYVVPTCPGADEAPLRRPDGSHACARVGADPSAAAGDWPDLAGALAPVVFVRPGGTGDGTMDAPLGDLATALARTPAPATIALGRGTFALPATLDLGRTVALRGSGAASTFLVGPAGAGALRVTAPAGATVAVTIAALSIRSAGADVGVVGVAGAGATCTLDGVVVEGGGDGLRADEGAAVCATGFTVRAGGQRGVVLLGGSRGFMRGFVVRDRGGVGVLVDRSHVTLDRGLVASNARDGVAVRGALRGAACATDEDCAAASPCPGFALAQRCVRGLGAAGERRCRSLDEVSDVAILGNRVTGLRAARTTPTADEVAAGLRDAVLSWPGPSVVGTRVIVAGTQPVSGAPGGDGLYVGAAAAVSLDGEVTSDADRGHASEFVGNARAGVLVDGDRSGTAGVPDPLRQAGRLSLAGALVASNRGPGVFVQERAMVDLVAFAEVTDNAALGLGVTSGGGVALMLCNRFIGTRLGTITPENAAVRPFVVGDGASMAQGTGMGARLRVVDSEFSGNQRFGLVLDSFDATLDDGARGGNFGRGNRFGLGVYGTASLDGTTARTAIQGTAGAAPANPPTARDSVPSAGGP